MTFTEACGSAGSFLLCINSIPQAIQCISQGHSHGINKTTNTMWLGGVIFLTIYFIFNNPVPFILANYLTNIMGAGIIQYYIYFPKKDEL